ncbi:50S ribosomal protein L3 [Candidatus Woesearchaeota archaeon]|mgnify:CR=1 FL=1|jgi:large subunit ribosomal protein L3|nr:50S ribosomal protein L3 [Candidatus Woesearchaeota archaeon]MBT6520319.1 50S ribosomal protein L3 [Candidatus Woesearchaeota archaeon]MBT7368272.1 50S ribosomal protein L3 [Candidatus Woesearchaeota archaeon]
MGKVTGPRHGSMGYWPRKRAKRQYAKINAWPESKDSKLLSFAGYKVGMTHAILTDNRKNSTTKGDEINFPVTIIECPPIKIAGINLYVKDAYGSKIKSCVLGKCDKELGKKICLPKKVDEKKIEDLKTENYSDVRVLVYTQPKLTGIGQKKPELFEVAIGGTSVEEKLNYAKGILGKEVLVSDVFSEGDQLDTHVITIGKGFQGPVKRFGVKIRGRKSEKTKRGPGSLGPWCGQQHIMYRVAHAGQTGYHQRLEFNKKLLKIGEKGDEINPIEGFKRYGVVKNTYLLVKGSVGGPTKRIIRFKKALRPNKKYNYEAPQIQSLNLRVAKDVKD